MSLRVVYNLPTYDDGRVSRVVIADKLHDLLMNPQSRPDLQTPEAQQWLQHLQEIHSPETDPLMPWMTREWKKGRIRFLPEAENPWDRMDWRAHMNPYDYQTANHAHQQWEAAGRGYEPLDELTMQSLTGWNAHPMSQGIDLMGWQTPGVAGQLSEYHAQLDREQRRAEYVNNPNNKGTILHTLPTKKGDWTIQDLRHPDALEYEGSEMGHCVGGHGYPDRVRRGDVRILSLRDHNNEPHATVELEPKRHSEITPTTLREAMDNHSGLYHLTDDLKDIIEKYDALHKQYFDPGFGALPAAEKEPILRAISQFNEDHPGGDWKALREIANNHRYRMDEDRREPILHGSRIQQIQGKGNDQPIDKYQSALKQFFATFPEEDRPFWDHSGSDVDDLMGGNGGYAPHGDYGVKDDSEYDWEEFVDNFADGYKDNSDEAAEAIVERAASVGQLHELQSEIETFLSRKEEEFKDDYVSRYSDDEIADQAGIDREEYESEDEDGEWEFDEYSWDEAIEDARRQLAEEGWADSEERSSLDRLEWAVKQQYRRQGKTKRRHKGKGHRHFKTGEPCFCTFNLHDFVDRSEEWHDVPIPIPSKKAAGPPPVNPRQPNTWGKAIHMPDGRVIDWTTGTRSLNGGSPHHIQVWRGMGLRDDDFFNGLDDGSVRLVQVDNKNQAWDCFNGRALPEEYYGASNGHVPYQKPEDPTDDLWK